MNENIDDIPQTDDLTDSDTHTPLSRDTHTYTIEQAARELELSVGHVRRLFKDHKVHFVRKGKNGKGSPLEYRAMDIMWLKQLRTEPGGESHTNTQTHTDESLIRTPQWDELAEFMARLDRYHQESLDYAVQLGATREQLGTVTAERDARITELEALTARIGDTEAERDEARARLRELEAVQQVEQTPAEPVRQYPRWMFWK